jgi:PAS domain S-box-containing protein
MEIHVDNIAEPLKVVGVERPDSGGFAAARQCFQSCRPVLQEQYGRLQAKYNALKAAQSDAIAAAIEEREQRLRDQQEHMAQLQTVMMMAADGILTIDDSGTIDSFNEAAGWIFGYQPAEVIGKNISMLLPEPHCGRHAQYMAKYLSTGNSAIIGYGREVVGQRKDGAIFPLDLSVSEVCIGGRRIFTGIFRDITQRRMLEVQLRQAQKLEAIGQLAAGIAHEINTPTQYIGDNARFLEDTFRDLGDLLYRCGQLSEALDTKTPSATSAISSTGADN